MNKCKTGKLKYKIKTEPKQTTDLEMQTARQNEEMRKQRADKDKGGNEDYLYSLCWRAGKHR